MVFEKRYGIIIWCFFLLYVLWGAVSFPSRYQAEYLLSFGLGIFIFVYWLILLSRSGLSIFEPDIIQILFSFLR